MRIAFFDFVTHFGGAPQCMVKTYEHLRATDEVAVVDPYGHCPSFRTALDRIGIPQHVLVPEAKRVVVGYAGRPLARMFSAAMQTGTLMKLRRRLVHKMLEIDPDVICTVARKALPFLATSRRLRRYPLVFYAHGWYKREQVTWFNRWLMRHRVRHVLTVSQATSRAMEGWGVARERISVVHNAFDCDGIIECANRGPTAHLPGAERFPKILLPATLLRTKGQHVAVEAVHLLKQRGLKPVLWLAGSVPHGVARHYLSRLEEFVDRHGLEGDVFFLGWRDDVPALMKMADLMVFPTHTEGLPRVIREAMLLRRPVISTASGGVTELITNGETGLLTGVDDSEALAQAIERLASDEELSKRLSDNAYRRLSERFSPEKHIELLRSALQRTLSAEAVRA